MAKTIPTTLALLVARGTVRACRHAAHRRHRRATNRRTECGRKPGMSMTAVESSYGAPSQRHAAVGGSIAEQPPITRWDYPAFSVYFENDRVIHAVARRQ